MPKVKRFLPYFKTIHDKRGCSALCVLYDKTKKRFSSGVSLVHKNDQRSINWQLGKNIALSRAHNGKNSIINRFPEMTFTDKNGDLHFQYINPTTYCLHLRVMDHWQNAQKELIQFYIDVKKQVPLDVSIIKNAKSHITMKVKAKT